MNLNKPSSKYKIFYSCEKTMRFQKAASLCKTYVVKVSCGNAVLYRFTLKLLINFMKRTDTLDRFCGTVSSYQLWIKRKIAQL